MREKLIAVAARMFEQDGYDFPLEAIVSAAGLGRGTLYRNFPDRTALMAEVLTYKLAEMERFVAAHDNDQTLLAEFVRRHGLAALLHATAVDGLRESGSLKLTRHALTERAIVLVEGVVVRCHAAGTLRPDATGLHLRLVIRMLSTLAGEPHERGDQRLGDAVTIVMEGLSPRGGVANEDTVRRGRTAQLGGLKEISIEPTGSPQNARGLAIDYLDVASGLPRILTSRTSGVVSTKCGSPGVSG